MSCLGLFAAVVCCACVAALSGEAVVGFNDADASSTFPSGAFAARRAAAAGGGYWCSAGNHLPSEKVMWTGRLRATHKVLGVRINWAYAPGQFKLLTSADGTNFQEAACWRGPSQAEASFAESVMFPEAVSASAVAIVMQSPQPWGYFGINDVSLAVEPYALMLVVGAPSPAGELCLVSHGAAARAEPCLDAVAAGDGREIFSFAGDGQVRNAAAGGCLAARGGDQDGAPGDGSVAFEKCADPRDAGDGRFVWEADQSGELRTLRMGSNRCLRISGTDARVLDCADAEGADGGVGEFSFVAVPSFDRAVASHARDVAALLEAAVHRQASLLAKLQAAVASSRSCNFAAGSDASQAGGLPAVSRELAAAAPSAAAEAPLQAVARMYSALGVDVARLRVVISETKRAIALAQAGFSRAA